MKDTFNEGMSHLTHVVALDPFLRRLQILLAFIKRLTFIKSS